MELKELQELFDLQKYKGERCRRDIDLMVARAETHEAAARDIERVIWKLEKATPAPADAGRKED